MTTGEPQGALYHQLLRAAWPGWWRAPLGIFVLVAGGLVVLPFVVLAPFALYFGIAGQDVATSVTQLLDLEHPTPAGLAYLNLVLAAMILLVGIVDIASYAARRAMSR